MSPAVAPSVTLLSFTDNPIRNLYMAYRVCYSKFTPDEITEKIRTEKITQDTMQEFVETRLATGHESPLEQVWFEFGISGVSRAFSHQFVRHRIGISFEQQSQRYVTYKTGEFPFVLPKSLDEGGQREFSAAMDLIGQLYKRMVDRGVPAEDARFILPNATSTNFKITVNFREMLHIGDLRLCTRAQWEFRKVAALMRAEIMRAAPELGRFIEPKCGSSRLGYCDEDVDAYEACPLSKVRPHKLVMVGMAAPDLSVEPLGEKEWEVVNDV